MSAEERLIADYAGTGLTIGKHPMAYRREDLRRRRSSPKLGRIEYSADSLLFL
jgi:hypothetical protein